MKRLIVIASGSKNNAALIDNNGKTILVDCGVSLRSLRAVYKDFSLDIENLQGVFVTHNHSDHTKYLETLKKNLNVPFYSSAEVTGCEIFNGSITLDGFEISSVCLFHDVPCCGYRVTMEQTSFCIATDTGVVSPDIIEAMRGCDVVMLESNHDVNMVKFGPYPPSLKSRILSRQGHLSNEDCSKTVAYLASQGLKKVVLAHISENNNTPLVARDTCLRELKKYGFDSVEIFAAEPMLEVEL